MREICHGIAGRRRFRQRLYQILIGLNTGKDIGTLQNINILENGPGGVVLTIEAVGDKGSVRVSTENKSGVLLEEKDTQL